MLVLFMLLVFFVSSGWTEITKIKNGDTLYGILKPYFNGKEIHEINKKISKIDADFVLKKGGEVEFTKNKITLRQNWLKDIVIEKTDIENLVRVVDYPVFTLKTLVKGVIEDSLFGAVMDVGEGQELVSAIADIFEGEIDFFKDIRRGDTFTLLVEKRFSRGKFIGYGKILAADFKNNGILYRAFYYEDNQISGYFTPDGGSFKKGFLKAPLKFGKITSKFTSKRLHPVLNTVKSHFGVDYSAPYGTPVHATADGKIIKRGYEKGGGNFVKIRHPNGYETTYMHFSKFANGHKVGSYVKQGEIIGYVGSTGYATGPHVDYRVTKNGKYVNPLAFKAPAVKLPKNKIESFALFIEPSYKMLNDSYTKVSRFIMLR